MAPSDKPIMRQGTPLRGAQAPDSDDEGDGLRAPFIIGVAGGTASGKTTVCDQIMQKLANQRVVVISQDSFYRGLTEEELANVSQYNFDHPDAFDNKELADVLRKIKTGSAVEVPEYDFVTHQRSTDVRLLPKGIDVVIMEGILVFHDESARNLMNMKIFVDTDADTRLARRIKRDTVSRGRSVEGVIEQYAKFVKPMFDQFVAPTKKYADIIVPRGGENPVAVDLITQHILLKLGQNDLRKHYPRLVIMPSNFQTKGMHTIIRAHNTARDDFVFYSDRLIRLVVEHGLGSFPFSETHVTTPVGCHYTGVDFAKRICGVSIIRSGESMENALRACCKGVKIGKMLVQRDDQGAGSKVLYSRLPQDIADRHVLLLDPILATGNSVIATIAKLIECGVRQERIVFISLIAAPEGVKNLFAAFPSITIVTTEVDEGLDGQGQVVPGIGNFGDRYFGTEDEVGGSCPARSNGLARLERSSSEH